MSTFVLISSRTARKIDGKTVTVPACWPPGPKRRPKREKGIEDLPLFSAPEAEQPELFPEEG